MEDIKKSDIDKDINSLNSLSEKVFKETKNSLNDVEKEALYSFGRKIIEKIIIFELKKKQNIGKFFKNNFNKKINILWNYINNGTHARGFSNTLITYLKDFRIIFNQVLKYFNVINNYENIFFPIDENILINDKEWEDVLDFKTTNLKDRYENYDAFILNKYEFNNFNIYKVSKKNKRFKQNKKVFFYSESSLFLEKYNFYKINTKIQFLKSSKKSKKVYRYFIKEVKIIPGEVNNLEKDENSIIFWKNKIINNFNISAMEYLKNKIYYEENLEDKEILNLISIFKNIYKNLGLHKLMNNLIQIKHFDEKIISESMSKDFNSMFYEYWTKNGYGNKKPLNLFEKELIFKLFEKTEIVKENPKTFFHKENEIFISRKLMKKVYFVDSWKNWKNDFENNNDFNFNYEQSKIVEFSYENKNVITCNENKELFSLANTFFKEEILFLGEEITSNFSNELDEEKKEILKKIININKSVIFGNAGTGKTLLISFFIKEIFSKKETIIYLAPTHKARSIINNFLQNKNIETKTIQKAIKEKDIFFNKYQNIIIDEISMIDDYVWKELINFIKSSQESKKNKRVIFLGDINQIEPINSVGFAKEVIKISESKIKFELKKNYRQSNNDLLLKEINNYLKNEKFKTNEFIEKYSSYEDFIFLLEKYYKYEKILTPIHYGIFGTNNLNKLLNQIRENGTNKDFLLGDKVLIIDDTLVNEVYSGLFLNKELEIKKIENNQIYFLNDLKIDKNVTFNYKNIKNWSISKDNKYVIYKIIDENDIPFSNSKITTIHNSQGSTYRNVIIIIPEKYNLKKSIVYTAISRASENFKILIHENDIDNYIE